MIFNMNFNPFTVKQTTRVTYDLGGIPFVVLTIGKDSYIVKASVETGLNLDANISETAGVYDLQIGKYSALAEDILFMIDIDHDYMSVAQGVVSEFSDMQTCAKKKRKGSIIIENDVWVGHGATIMNGVTVHNGAVIAANAVVTKDVPPYAVVGGNPARVLRYRFSDSIIDKLLKISWWNWSSEDLYARRGDFAGDPEVFCQKYYMEAVEKEKLIRQQESPIESMTYGKKYLLIPEFADAVPLYEKIVRAFCKKFNGTDAQLVVEL